MMERGVEILARRRGDAEEEKNEGIVGIGKSKILGGSIEMMLRGLGALAWSGEGCFSIESMRFDCCVGRLSGVLLFWVGGWGRAKRVRIGSNK